MGWARDSNGMCKKYIDRFNAEIYWKAEATWKMKKKMDS
jgi:hypothetical protein